MWRDIVPCFQDGRGTQWSYPSTEHGDSRYLGNTGTFALGYTLPYPGAVFVLVIAMRTLTLTLLTWRIWLGRNNASKWQMGFNLMFKGLNLMLVIQHPNTCQNNQNAPYTVFSSMSVPSSGVALLFSEHCSAISLSVFFRQHERPLQNTRCNHGFVYFNTDVS